MPLASLVLLAIVATGQEILTIVEKPKRRSCRFAFAFHLHRSFWDDRDIFCKQAYSNYFANLYRNYSYYSTDYPTGQGYGHDFIDV